MAIGGCLEIADLVENMKTLENAVKSLFSGVNLIAISQDSTYWVAPSNV